MLTYCNGPKVGIKLLKLSHVILFLVSLLFVAVINPYSIFKFSIFKYYAYICMFIDTCVLMFIVENRPLYIVAELISSAKKSLARMLLIIVSLGYGTVK